MSEELGIFQDLDTWLEIKKRAVNIYPFAAFNQSVTAGTTGVVNRAYTPNATPPRTAFEVHGYSIQAMLISSGALATASTTAVNEDNVGFVATYTQPQPPAANATTDASTSGNLGIRNLFYSLRLSAGSVQFQGVTLSALGLAPTYQFSLTKFFAQPTRFAMSQLEFYVSVFSSAGNLNYDFQTVLYGKLVQVSEAEYNNLIALSSGQAVLSEVITA